MSSTKSNPSRTLSHILRRYPALSRVVPPSVQEFPLASTTSSPLLRWAITSADALGDNLLTALETYSKDAETVAGAVVQTQAAHDTTTAVHHAIHKTNTAAHNAAQKTNNAAHRAAENISENTYKLARRTRVVATGADILSALSRRADQAAQAVRNIQIHVRLRRESVQVRRVIVGLSGFAVDLSWKLAGKVRESILGALGGLRGIMETEMERERKMVEGVDDIDDGGEVRVSTVGRVGLRVVDRVAGKVVTGAAGIGKGFLDMGMEMIFGMGYVKSVEYTRPRKKEL
ncbi:hypothetical protein EDC01DRAFT_647330 [Geopyxis carbonaria]|nr:hypothetical protein EDC01DRAFT_647330 [Geopyxis carbonaria]